jgi:hypothetical protein
LEKNAKARNIDEAKRLEKNAKARNKRTSKKAGASLEPQKLKIQANMAVGKFDGKHLMNDIFSSSGVTEANGI